MLTFPTDAGKANCASSGRPTHPGPVCTIAEHWCSHIFATYQWTPKTLELCRQPSGDSHRRYARFGRGFWEQSLPNSRWALQQSTVENTGAFAGREHAVFWENNQGDLARSDQARIQGGRAWGKWGIAVCQIRNLPCTLYTGELFDNNVAVILPKQPSYLPAIWAFCQSPTFNVAVRNVDSKISVTNATLVKVPFDLTEWQAVADEAGPLPEPYSNDPTQWLFAGHPTGSTEPLQVAVARLLGYRWPQQGEDNLAGFADADGIVCLPAVRRRASRRATAANSAGRGLRCGVVAGAVGWSAGSGRLCGQEPRRVVERRILHATLPAVPQPPLHLAHLGRPQGRLRGPGQLPQAGCRQPDNA